MRIASLVLGTIISAFWLLMIVGAVFSPDPLTIKGLEAGGFVMANSVGIWLSYKLRRVGPIIVIVAGIGFSVFAYFSASTHRWYAVLVSGVPFAVIGALLLLSYLKAPK